MLKLDNNLLDELGLGGLPEDQKRAMLQHIYETLELRVGTNLANQMTDQQLEEFEKFIDDGGDANQAQALQWLETNLPNYKQVVNEVFEALKVEVKEMAPQLMAASAPSAPAPVQPQPQMPSQQPVPMYRQGPPQTPPADQGTMPQQVSQTPPMGQGSMPSMSMDQSAPMTPPAPQPMRPPMGMGYQQPGPQQMPAQDPRQSSSVPQQTPPQNQNPAGYPFPPSQPPAGPGGYPPQGA